MSCGGGNMIIEHTKVAAFTLAKLKAFIMSDSVTGGVAIASILSPAWLPVLYDISAYAGVLMPIFGVAWLIVQIVTKVYETFIKRKKR